ncbi:MAG TPA: metallophosphoesterase family protein [Polyangiaceae bacterium]|nr:metallophosphoesterase family protein [Polyangiaceae bacterium]
MINGAKDMAYSVKESSSGRRKPVHARETIRLEGPALRIVAVADTHGQPHPALDERLRELAPAHILHAGDVGDLEVLRRLEKHAPVTAVRGNIDGRDLPDFVTITLAAARPSEAALLRILLTHVAVYGPKLRADVARIAKAEDATLVVCGHSHVPFATHDRGVTVFNPGSVGPRRFRLPIVLGVVDVTAAGVSLRHVDCETGKPWTPRDAPPPRF